MSAGATIPGGRHATAGFSSAKLTNIACWTPGRCMVVGTFVPSSTAGATGPSGATLYGNPSETLAEVSTASGWRIVRSANAGAGGSQLYGVACPAPSDCIAVGHEQPLSPAATGYRAPSYRPLVEVYSGTALHLEAVPSVGSSAAFLGASCPRPGRCFAVGYSVMAGRLSALIESDAGGVWKVVPAASPTGASTQLVAISCPSAQACVAVGSYSPKGDATAERPLVESLHNGSFALGTAPVAKGTNAILYDVSCASATSCVAVGQSSLTATRSAPLVERWQGSTWTSTPGATAAGSSAGALVSVSCPTGAGCVAVGWEAQATTLPETPLVNRLAAGKVSALAVPSAPVAFSAALCATETQCTAVGDAGADPYIGRFSGSNWVASASPSP